MTSSNLLKAVDVALKILGCKKLCSVCEDEEAYYFTACSENGEPIFGEATCRVEKDTLDGKNCFRTDACWKTPKKVLPFPEERSDVFMKLVGYEYLYD